MVKTHLELDHRRRQQHFNTSKENQRLNQRKIREILTPIHAFIFDGWGLDMRCNLFAIGMQIGGQVPKFELKVFKNEPITPSVQYDCQFLREKLNMSEEDYKVFERVLSGHIIGIPKLHTSNDIKHQMNGIFPLLTNELGVFLQNPIEKVDLMVTRYVRKNQDSLIDDTLELKISGDSTSISKKQLKVLNSTFTIINDKANCESSNGNYILSCSEIQDETYDNIKTSLKELLNALSNLTEIEVDGRKFKIIKYLGGDLKFLAHMYGLNAAQSRFPCIWCDEYDAYAPVDPEKIFKINRKLESASQKMSEKGIDKRVGHIKEPIITFIEFDHCIIDLLHLHLRITDQLFTLLINAFNEKEDTGANLSLRPNFSKYLDFLQVTCKISKPYYFSTNENGTATIKMRALNGNERDKVFITMFKNKNMIDLFPELEERLQNLNFIFKEYFELLTLVKTFALIPTDLGGLETRLRKWLSFYIIESALIPRKNARAARNEDNGGKITPYIHSFVFHMSEFLINNPDLNSFNIQGLENLNHITTKNYHTQSNKKPDEYLKQIIQKRNREELLETRVV